MSIAHTPGSLHIQWPMRCQWAAIVVCFLRISLWPLMYWLMSFLEISTSFVVSSILLIDVGWHAAKQGKLRAHVRVSSRLCHPVSSRSHDLVFGTPGYFKYEVSTQYYPKAILISASANNQASARYPPEPEINSASSDAKKQSATRFVSLSVRRARHSAKSST